MSSQNRTKGPWCSGRSPTHSPNPPDSGSWLRLLVRSAVLFLVLLPAPAAIAQESGMVSGMVVNNYDGTPLPGVVVTVRGTTLAGQTDADGRFELKQVPAGDQVLRFSKSGFAAVAVTDVRVLTGQSTTVNGSLRPEFYEMEEYEVTAEEFSQQTEQILIDKKEAGSFLDAIGSEQFSKLGAGDAGQIVQRVTGVSVVGGKFAVVRGLSDRYTRTLLNGMEVPSADPYRLSPQLDLFPSAMIDRVSVSKTFTPDQPGGTGGGMIDIATKSFPEEPFLKVSFGTSYNPNSNLRNDFLADPDSSLAMFAWPSGPDPLESALFGLRGVPDPPGPSSSRETPARAQQRAEQANAVQNLLQSLGTANFAGVGRNSPLNSGFNASAGKTTTLFGRKLGMFAGINYSRKFLLIEDAEVNRILVDFPLKLGTETRGNIITDYGANVNLGYEVSDAARFGYNFMLAANLDDEARHGTFGSIRQEDPATTLEQWQLHYTDRQIINHQLSGHHELPALGESKVDWLIGYANTSQDEPDQRFMNYYVDAEGRPAFGSANLPFPQHPSRYFREIDEESWSSRLDWTLPLEDLEQNSKLKAGFFTTRTSRDFREQYFTYTDDGTMPGFSLDNPNSYLNDPAYLEYMATYLGGIRTNYSFLRWFDDAFANPYTARLNVTAGYALADMGMFPWLRMVGGARIENTLMEIDAETGDSRIHQTDLLPAVSAIVSLRTNLDLRLSYSQTIARPSFREKAPVNGYLPDLGVTGVGNPELTMTSIRSLDARVEWFPEPGDIVSAGVFHKRLTDPIEMVARSLSADQVTWVNRTNHPATVLGVEFEGRKSLDFLTPVFRGLALGANITLIKSKATLSDDEYNNKTDPDRDGTIDFPASRTRPLYDQSPYIINLDLSYDHPTSGTSLVVGVNLTGERLAFATPQGEDVYEHPEPSLDAAISQQLWKHWKVRFGVRNILNPEYRVTYGKDYDGDIFLSYKRGRTYGVTLTAEF